MQKQSLFCLVTAWAVLSVSVTRAEPSAALQVAPITFKINLDPQFELRDGILTLKEYDDSDAGLDPAQILWSAPLNAPPLYFVLETTEGDATLKDDGGHVLWVEHFTVPSLTLDFSQSGQATLIGASGQTLWTGPWDGKRTSRSGGIGRAECNGFTLLTPKGVDARLEDSQGKLLWAGPEPAGEGLYIIDYGQRSSLAWHSNPFPVNEKFSYEIADMPETVTLRDSKQIIVGTQLVPIIQITKRYSQGYYATHPIVSQRMPTIMPRPLVTGIYSLVFQDKEGGLVQSQTLNIDSVHATALDGGRTLETAHFHRITRNAAGTVTEDITGSENSAL